MGRGDVEFRVSGVYGFRLQGFGFSPLLLVQLLSVHACFVQALIRPSRSAAGVTKHNEGRDLTVAREDPQVS